MDEYKTIIDTLQSWAGISMHRSMRDFELFARQSGLSMPQFNVLMRLHYRPKEYTVSDIAEQMDITNAAASQLIQRLVESGMITRTEDQDDRRVKLIDITDAGENLVHEAMERRRKWLESVVDTLAPEDRSKVELALSSLVAAARQYEMQLAQQEKTQS